MFNFNFMNSLQKQSTDQKVETPEEFVSEFEKKLLAQSLMDAELTMKKLKYLGINFDPFNSEIETECQQVMDSFGLTEHMKNPYLATNILLRLLDKTEERINNLKQ
jgi:hypothetical protein